MIFCIKVGVVQSYMASKFFLIRNNDETLNINMMLNLNNVIDDFLIKVKFVKR